MTMVIAQAAPSDNRAGALSNAVATNAPESIREGFALAGDKLDGWVDQFILLIPNLVAALLAATLFLTLSFAGAAVVRHTVRRGGRQDLARMLASFVFWLTLFIGFLVVITILLPAMRTVDIFASLGIGSVALGFAFKDILQNWIAGFFILIRRPFHRGDQIAVGDIEGTVQAVETRATLVKTYDGSLVIVPNSDIYMRAVTVHTAYPIRRHEIVIPVSLDADLDHVVAEFRAAMLTIANVLKEPPPEVLPWEFRENNIDLRVRWWAKPQRTYEVYTRAAVLVAIKRAAENAGIVIPSDTKISFGTTPLLVARAPVPETKPPANQAAIDRAPDAELALARVGDETTDPEAEKPKSGDLSKGAEEVPR